MDLLPAAKFHKCPAWQSQSRPMRRIRMNRRREGPRIESLTTNRNNHLRKKLFDFLLRKKYFTKKQVLQLDNEMINSHLFWKVMMWSHVTACPKNQMAIILQIITIHFRDLNKNYILLTSQNAYHSTAYQKVIKSDQK